MLVTGKYIMSVNKYLDLIKDKDNILIAIECTEDVVDNLKKIGIEKIEEGTCFLPRPIGPKTTFNVFGKYIKQKHLPKETAYREADWHWKDWGGHEYSKTVYIPYKRYPRLFIAPPSVELLVIKKEEKFFIVNNKPIDINNLDLIKNTINVFLEIFNKCFFLSSDTLSMLSKTKIVRLNWEILPKGEYPWKRLDSIIKSVTKSNRQVIVKDRWKHILSHNPDFQASGSNGFFGYVIFGFKDKGIYIAESAYTDNATYVFDVNWEGLSTMTKAEILNDKLQKFRVIHRDDWHKEVDAILK